MQWMLGARHKGEKLSMNNKNLMPLCKCGHLKYRHSYWPPFKCKLTRIKFFGEINKCCNCKGYDPKTKARKVR